nr:SoxR reducing system RseC family protein [Roseospirillum parvum]
MEAERRPACGACAARASCASRTFGGWLGRRPLAFSARLPFAARPGQEVVVGLSSRAVLKAAGLAYMLPLLILVLSAATASALGLHDLWVAAIGGLGLLAGLALAGRLARRLTVPALSVLGPAPDDEACPR